jgi:hypothetical protein
MKALKKVKYHMDNNLIEVNEEGSPDVEVEEEHDIDN